MNGKRFIGALKWMIETINKISPNNLVAKMSHDIPHLSIYTPAGFKYKVVFFSQYKEHPWTVIRQENVGQFTEQGLLEFIESLVSEKK